VLTTDTKACEKRLNSDYLDQTDHFLKIIFMRKLSRISRVFQEKTRKHSRTISLLARIFDSRQVD